MPRDIDKENIDVNNEEKVSSMWKTQALSWLTASTLALATFQVVPVATLDLPASSSSTTTSTVLTSLSWGVPVANAATTNTGKTDAAAAATTTRAVKKTTTPAVKLSKEERERSDAKRNYDLAQQTLKEYQKYVNDLDAAFQKADKGRVGAVQQATQAKNAYIKASDKLSKAKNDRMPSSAIQELSKETAQLKQVLKDKEATESDSTKRANSLSKDLKSGQQAIKDSQNAIQKAKKRLDKAEKSYQQYAKRMQQEKKLAEQKLAQRKRQEQKMLKEQEAKVRQLEKDSSKLKSKKEQEAKELAAKQKALEAELKNLERLKSKTTTGN